MFNSTYVLPRLSLFAPKNGLDRNDFLILGDQPLGALSGTQMATAFSQGFVFILAEEFAMVMFHVMTNACTGFALTVHLSNDAIGVLENKEEDIVIVGAGMAGSTTALGLHRFMGLVECDGR
ncbi:hypothetical protein RHGRI_015891 [Rhododendron griersonianum]|nr:hypothetical protein RHGRI_015891 [Rhododendron griersonianum]